MSNQKLSPCKESVKECVLKRPVTFMKLVSETQCATETVEKYLSEFLDETIVKQKKGKFKEVDPKVYARIAKMMKGRKDEKQSLANMLNYFMPPEVVDMVRDKFGIKTPRGKIKFTDL